MTLLQIHTAGLIRAIPNLLITAGIVANQLLAIAPQRTTGQNDRQTKS